MSFANKIAQFVVAQFVKALMIATRTWFEIQGVTVDTTYVIGTIDDNDWVIIDLRV